MKTRYNTIIMKSSEEPGKIPQVSDLQPGELAINIADGKLFTLKLTDGQYEVIEIGSGSSSTDTLNPVDPGVIDQGMIWSSIEGTSDIERYPSYGYYDYSHSMFIIRAEELESNPMLISGIEVEVSGYTAGYTLYNQTIKLAHTTDIEFGSNVQVDLSGINGLSNLTEVKTGYDWIINQSGYQYIPFDNQFEWNGTDNLLVIWENRDSDWGSGFGWAECQFDNTYYSSWYKYADGSYPSGYGTRDQSYRPNFKLHY